MGAAHTQCQAAILDGNNGAWEDTRSECHTVFACSCCGPSTLTP